MKRSYIPAERQKLIREYLIAYRVASLAELGEILNTSQATVRRDLEKLEMTGFLERTRGGAILSRRLSQEAGYHQRMLHNPQEKRNIGKAAANLIKDGDVIFINGGTTTVEIVRHIRPDSNVTIITNNLSVVTEITEIKSELIIIGGKYQASSRAVGGHNSTLLSIENIYADRAFLGVDGLSIKYGITFPLESEAEITQKMIERTRGPIYLVADHSKWGTVSTYEVAKINEIHGLITDKAFDVDTRHELISQSIDVIIAE